MLKAKKSKAVMDVVIYTLINNRKNYVHRLRPCHAPGKLTADYTNNVDYAEKYKTLDAAQLAIKSIHNLLDRVYQTEFLSPEKGLETIKSELPAAAYNR